MALTVALIACFVAVGCGDSEGGKSPFATGNVSVAPQVDGRAPAATPVPPPPAEQPTAESE